MVKGGKGLVFDSKGYDYCVQHDSSVQQLV